VVEREDGPAPGTQPRCSLVTGERMRLAVRAGVHLDRAELSRELRDLFRAVTPQDQQAPAPLAQARVEVAQAFQQEAPADARIVLALVHAGVERERAHHGTAALEGRCDRRLVVEPEVAPEPDERWWRA
jgi:hypothetical protein